MAGDKERGKASFLGGCKNVKITCLKTKFRSLKKIELIKNLTGVKHEINECV